LILWLKLKGLKKSMNATITQIYHMDSEKAILSLVGLVLSPLLSCILYYLARKRLNLKKDETSKSKAHLFYRMVSGILLAQFLGHTYWYAPFWFIGMFVCIGYFFMDASESIGRLWNKNDNYIGPTDYSAPQDIGLNKKTHVRDNIIVADDLTSSEFAHEVFLVEDDVKDLKKRQWILFVLLLCLFIISCVDGFHLAVTPSSILLIVSYYVHGACLSVAVYSTMIHAQYHTEATRRWFWWCMITLLWSLIFFCSAIFVLLPIPSVLILDILNHKAFVAIYGFASGILLKLQHYFHGIHVETRDKNELWLGIGVFFAAVTIAMLTSIYL
jgi:hypothetical protein